MYLPINHRNDYFSIYRQPSEDFDDWDAIEESFPAGTTGNTTSLSVELPNGADRYFILITVIP
ncbi:MAG: hypothetical protein ABJQ29_12355 [Luteolibacter sp.]